jgi:uncharacterized membrane protein
MKNVKWIIIGGLVLLIVGFLLGYLVFPKTVIRTVIQEVDVDSTAIVQEARLGYVTEDQFNETLKLLNKEKNYRFLKVDQRFDIKDSVVVRDSVVTRFIPFFAADTNFTFAKETDKWKFDTNIGVETKFYPGVRMMETRAKMNTLNITVTYEQPWKFDLTSGGVGFGAGALFTGAVVYLVK